MLRYANPRPEEKIIEFSTGSGYLTLPLASAVRRKNSVTKALSSDKDPSDIGPSAGNGKIITYDVVAENKEHVAAFSKKYDLPVDAKCFSFASPYIYHFEEADNSIDKVISLATFHHCDVRRTAYNDHHTGIRGRTSIFEEVSRVLVPDGVLVIGDVAENTMSQRYFDAIQEPQYCSPHGHPHSFLSRDTAEEFCRSSGLALVHYAVEDISWHFNDEPEAIRFFHGLHNAQCSLEELGQIVKSILPFRKTEQGISVGWQLCFLTAKK